MQKLMIAILIFSITVIDCFAMEEFIKEVEKSYMEEFIKEVKKPYSDELLNKFYENILNANKQYCDIPRNPLLIMLSGSFGMGKTVLAQKLQTKLKILYFNSFDTLKFLNKENYFSDASREEMTEGIFTCFSYFIEHIKHLPNKAVILDESIDPPDSIYSRLVSTNNFNYPMYIIRLAVDKQIAFDRIKNSVADNFENFTKDFEISYNAYSKFKGRVDYCVGNNEDNKEKCPEDIPLLLEILERKLTPSTTE
jgi:dephospho-CoA kinase